MITRRTLPALVVAALLAPVGCAGARHAASAGVDAALVGRILLAEDRRDASDASLTEGAQSGDARVRTLAERARGRITDAKFATRASLPPMPPPPVWAEADWRLRLRALAGKRADCAALRAALADSAWPVRLGAIDLAGRADSPCASDDALTGTLRKWVDDLPADASIRSAGGVSWHAAAHSIVALARLRPADARTRTATLARHRQWQVRLYAARAAAILSDTTRLRGLARDLDDNVKEAAIGGLSKLTGHRDDATYLYGLDADGAQAVRAAAIALKGSTRIDAVPAANATFERWVTKGIASAHDARVALLDAAGRPASDDRPPPIAYEVPPDAVALALGADIRLRVTMAPASGGGSFVVRLRGDVAPMMAARILAAARAGTYNGRTWHRVEHDFVIQGGSPGANEFVGSAQFLRDELGTVPHVRGTVGMSTRGHDTGDFQWFVNLRDNVRLNPDYTVFGEIVSGIETVDGILEGDVIQDMREERGTGSEERGTRGRGTRG